MSPNDNGSFKDSPAFQEAMGHFRVGRWEEGLLKLAEVEKTFPTATELRGLRQEMEIRARISEYEAEENKHNRGNKIKTFTVRFFLGTVIVILLVGAIMTYSGWIQGQVARAQTSYAQGVQQAELIFEFRAAQSLMTAGKPDEALKSFESIKAKQAEYPGLAEAIQQAQSLKDIEVEYTQAMNLLQVGDSAQALQLLQGISEEMPNYRDVSLQIKNLQTQTEMSSVLEQADLAFLEGRYEDAISNYESLRIMNPSFQTTQVEENLFQSYIKAAQELLLAPVPTLENLKIVDHYFTQALSLKPLDREALAARTQVRLVSEDGVINDYVSQAQAALAESPDGLDAQQKAEHFLSLALGVRPDDPNVLLQFQLAQTFIQAISDFNSSKWGAVIDNLEFVIEQQAGYASGTALQTLFDAYIARGAEYIASGEYALALSDFQRAAVLAQQLEESDALAFEAQVMIGEAQGLLNHYQQAVQIYQEAMNTIGLRERIINLQGPLNDSLMYADYLANAGNYQSAFYAYRNLIRNRVQAYDQSTLVTVKNGDYLSMLAHRYNTTVAAILSANDLNNQPKLTPNTTLVIPILP
ncbi:MAG: LysM peptidoglycan-binding domain-containing protein [Anaerolineae bacterium]|nr:LysM peptidoglycan-binding domain-containing protein [Anaerolineae bacterium]